jgi:hypothetical protein
MAKITPSDEAVYYVVQAVDVGGITQDGENTGINNALAEIHDDGELKFLNKTKNIGTYRPLPESGLVSANEIYGYGNGLVIVRKTHNRTGANPADEPLLFLIHVQGRTVIDWITDESIKRGCKRQYNGGVYKCIKSHITSADVIPSSSPEFWELK